MKRIIKILYTFLFVASAVILSSVGIFQNYISDSYCVIEGTELKLYKGNIVTSNQLSDTRAVAKNGTVAVNGYNTKVSLFSIIPIKTVNVTEVPKTYVDVLGTPFGIKMFTEGVLVVGYSDIDDSKDSKNPAKDADIKVGDIILKINGQNINSNEDMQEAVRKSGNNPLEVLVKRENNTFTVSVTPIKGKNQNNYKIGLWIRDSQAGIGTLTFYSTTLEIAAGLGHGICDSDTGKLIPFQSGQFVGAEIVGINKADKNHTGELRGVFSGGDIAEICKNDQTGVYAKNCNMKSSGTIMEVALKQEVTVGKAQILTTLDESGPKYYECTIKKVYHKDTSKIKNMVIEITDRELLEKTGGIVQGMSGSPIIQNGKLIGAVTHVLVNDCTTGYGIFAENMIETARGIIN